MILDDGECLKKRLDNIVVGGVLLLFEVICCGLKFIYNCIFFLNMNYFNKF